ncbi:20219_t:CDS:2 [Gigaspora margarita]|uniref:20219_t:CDS:1 n=1 Tax=Gigaspora margarita TaxID=4874 RepID=A0ABN7VBV7_GIGMA|nr:20219_t:CDS:2 [Gigaspora margarita]
MWSQSDSNSDVKIVAGSEPNIKEFSAHSSVLRSRSLYFQRALSERWKNKKHGIYIITKPNIHPNIFMLILDYIYTKKKILPESAEDSLNILIASDELELLDLVESAQKHLIKKFSSWLLSNLVMSLNVVCRHNHFHKLYDHVLKITFRNPYSLFNSSDLPLLDEVAMICLLESDELELEEIEIWNYLIKWSISKFLDDDITNWSDENVSRWSDEHFVALKETISHNDNFLKLMLSTEYLTLKKESYFSTTSNSFIFSFTDQSNPVLSRVKTERKNVAIRNDEQRGPSFGTDLCMENSTRWTSYWGTYEHEIIKSNHLIAEEYELFMFRLYLILCRIVSANANTYWYD